MWTVHNRLLFRTAKRKAGTDGIDFSVITRFHPGFGEKITKTVTGKKKKRKKSRITLGATQILEPSFRKRFRKLFARQRIVFEFNINSQNPSNLLRNFVRVFCPSVF